MHAGNRSVENAEDHVPYLVDVGIRFGKVPAINVLLHGGEVVDSVDRHNALGAADSDNLRRHDIPLFGLAPHVGIAAQYADRALVTV